VATAAAAVQSLASALPAAQTAAVVACLAAAAAVTALQVLWTATYGCRSAAATAQRSARELGQTPQRHRPKLMRQQSRLSAQM
jgi:2-C-methyl-D-erythritol 4-phosphate cytidylyltransferase